MSHFMLEAALKDQQWQIAKGHLKALIALVGSQSSGINRDDEPLPFEKLEAVVDDFIQKVEDEELHVG